MRRRAARTDANQTAIVLALRAAGTAVLSLAALGKGVPDLLCWRAGKGYVLLEIKDGQKSPSRRQLSPDQIDWHAAWPGPIAVVNSVQEALQAVGALPAG